MKCLFCKNEFTPTHHKKQAKFCSQSCSASFNNFNRKFNIETKKKIGGKIKQYYATHSHHHKGEFLPRENRNCQFCKSVFSVLPKSKKKFCSKKCSNEGLKVLMIGKSGGFREKAGRGKQGIYQGFYYNSSWELAWIVYNLDHNISFSRNTIPFEYTFEGKKHKFYPDFLINENEYVEVKGYNSKQFEAKKSQFPHKLIIIDKQTILPYTQYVKEKYGEELLKKS